MELTIFRSGKRILVAKERMEALGYEYLR